jgi:serine/threonine-protein kinase
MTQFGDYILEERLRSGRLTEMWRAQWLRAPSAEYQTVALKILRAEYAYSTVEVERFNNEIRATYLLRHPHIAAPLEWGVYDERRYFATQFIHGLPLSRWTGRGPLPTDFALSVLHRVADALDYAHSQGVVHRDVKPDNVLITAEGTPYLVDFGIALANDVVRLTRINETIGTTVYVAPEVIQQQTVTGATDVYSLAIMAYEMLTGSTPFTGHPIQVTYHHVNTIPPAPSERNQELPLAVDLCIGKALEKDPSKRYQSAKQFVRQLQAALSGEAVLSTMDSIRLLPRQQPVLFPVLLGVGGGVLVIFLILALALGG